jgi:hypothetical protein
VVGEGRAVGISAASAGVVEVGVSIGSIVGVSEVSGAGTSGGVQAVKKQNPRIPIKTPKRDDIRLISFLQSAQMPSRESVFGTLV